MQIDDIESLVDSEGLEIYKFCMNITGNKDEAEELYQQTFLKAMEVIEKIDKYRNPKSFLISIAVGLWKNISKKKGRRNRIAPMVSGEEALSYVKDNGISLEDEIIIRELTGLLNEIIINLKEKLKIPIVMYYNLGLTIEDISKILKIPTGTVKSRLYKGREVIKNQLEVNGYEGWQ